MAAIHGVIQFGVRVKITTPLVPDQGKMKTMFGTAERLLTAALLGAVSTTLKILPGVTAELTDAKAGISVEKVEP